VCSDIRKEAEKTNLKLELLRDRIIDSTWEKMEVPSIAMKSVQNDNLIFNFSIRKKTPKEQKTLMMLLTSRKIELMEKYRRQEFKLKEALNMKDFVTGAEGYFMNRMAGKPQFMTDESIAEAAAEFAAKDAEKKMKRNAQEQVSQVNKGEEGKRKPYLKLTKGRLGTKVSKKDDGDVVVAQVMERDIQGMESMHWKVVYLEKDLEELKKALEGDYAPTKPDPKERGPNIYNFLYEAFELYTD
jgi:hypothetical protein